MQTTVYGCILSCAWVSETYACNLGPPASGSMKVQLYTSHHLGEQASSAPGYIERCRSVVEAVKVTLQAALAW